MKKTNLVRGVYVGYKKCLIILAFALSVGCGSVGHSQEPAPTAGPSADYNHNNNNGKNHSLPRGLRNKNPGNIIKTNTHWKGEIPCADRKFECFSDERYGIRAAGIILNTYWERYSARTVADFIHRWAPPSDGNPTDNYIEFVQRRILGRHTDRSIDGIGRLVIRGRLDFPYLLAAIIEFENGYNPYSIEYIKEAMAYDPNGADNINR